MFEEEYNRMPEDDKKAFAEMVNDLMLTGFIVRDLFDNREKAMKINPRYRYGERYLEIISEYMSFAGWLVEKDALNGVITLSNSFGQNRLKMDRETSLVIFTLRLIYETEKSASSQPGESLYLTTPALMKTMIDHGIVFPGKKLTGRLLAKPLRFLSNHNVIAKVSGNYDEGNVSFYLLPSIIYAVDNQKIAAMSDAIDKQTGVERGDDE
jgi:hypothetical protein